MNVEIEKNEKNMSTTQCKFVLNLKPYFSI